ncbi:MAG: AraC family transcriptional regulator [Chitinophagales bacterium]|nr:AraC family transcriptional regulator [Chitinophagales bacterium]
MIHLNQYFKQTDKFPKIEVDQGFRFIEYRSYEESTGNQVWSERNFIVFVLQGKKTIMAAGEQYKLNEEKALFLSRGGYVMSEIPRTRGLFQSVLFFIDDIFLKTFATRHSDLLNIKNKNTSATAIPIEITTPLSQFYQSVLPYFNAPLNEARRRGLSLKFEELLLNLIAEPENESFSNFLASLLTQQADLRLVMEQNFHLHLPLEAFAQLAQRSLSTFKRDFKNQFGESPGKWLLKRRLQQASQLLEYTELSITDIAFRCGFESPSYFSQAFSKHFKQSPRNWRLQSHVA